MFQNIFQNIFTKKRKNMCCLFFAGCRSWHAGIQVANLALYTKQAKNKRTHGFKEQLSLQS